MAEGYHDFTAGETLTAANLEDYCQNQGIMRFASAAARDTALSTVKTEGMFAYLIDTNTITVYNGSAWSTIGPVHGAFATFDPVVTQSGAVSHTVANSTWCRVGRLIQWRFTISISGTGTGTNLVTLSTPVNINYVSDYAPIGHGQIYDSSVTTMYQGQIVPASASTIKIANGYNYSGAPSFLGALGFQAALASGDAISGMVLYEAAADA